MTDVSLIGLYSLYFLNCPNYGRSLMRSHEITFIDLSMVIEEKNFRGYLSAGEEPLPSLYFSLSIVFFILGLVWVQVIRTRKDDAFKIHYLMGALVFVKALALFFHSVSIFHFLHNTLLDVIPARFKFNFIFAGRLSHYRPKWGSK